MLTTYNKRHFLSLILKIKTRIWFWYELNGIIKFEFLSKYQCNDPNVIFWWCFYNDFPSFYSFIYFLSWAIEHLITAYIQKDCVRHMGMIYIWLKSTIIFFWQFLLTWNAYTEHSRSFAMNEIKRLYTTSMCHANNNSI